jgi:hypothetical protein
MPHRPPERATRPDIVIGERLTRRAFLRAMAATGIAGAGIAASAGGGHRWFSPRTAAAQQARPDRIADLAAELSYDVEAIFGFVRDAIRYEPYVGILRGADGTLAARAGNSADQALLLAALLDASFIPYRYVQGRLDPTVAEVILASGLTDAAGAASALADAFAGTLSGSTPPTGPEGIPQAATLPSETVDEVRTWAVDQVSGTVGTIEEVLRGGGVELPRTFSPMPARELDEHVWVQAALGSDWRDLDPTLPSSEAGATLVEATTTLDALPDELRHRVELAVVGEQVEGDTVSSRELMRISSPADALAGLPITFLNANPTGVQRLAEAITPIAATTTYVPTLVVGGEVFVGQPIGFGQAVALEQNDLFDDGDLLGAARSGEATAEWLEIHVVSPDREPVVVRRAVFDRFGPAARADGRLDPELLGAAPEVPLPDGTNGVLPALGSTWLTVSVGTPDANAAVFHQQDEDPGAPATIAQGLHVYREMGDVLLGVPLGVRSFIDAPNLVAYTIGPRTDGEGRDRVEAVLDILHRSRATSPVSGTLPAAPPATLSAVLDHVVERLMAGEAQRSPTDDGSLPLASVGGVFDAAHREGVGLRVVRTPEDVAGLDYPSDARAILAASLLEGRLAIAPQALVTVGSEGRAGWWLIDPVTGHAIDQLDDGRGAAAERIALDATVMSTQTAFRRLAQDCLAGSAMAFAAIVFLGIGAYAASQGDAWSAFVEGVSGTAEGFAASHFLKGCIRAAL